MKRLSKWGIFLLFLGCVALFSLYMLHSEAAQDSDAPAISFDAQTVTLSVYDDQAVLLQGVSAYDAKDGDVTDSLVVEGISDIREDDTVTVTYAAFDSAGNVAKATRTALFTDYTGIRFSLSAPLIFRSGDSSDVFSCLVATDSLDGDLSDQIKASLTGETTSLSTVGLHEIEIRVTNSMGQTARLTLPVEVNAADAYNASLTLTEYLIYLPAGEPLDPGDYLNTLVCGQETISLQSVSLAGLDVEIESDVDADTAGVYSVSYTVTYGSYTAHSRLIVVVEE